MVENHFGDDSGDGEREDGGDGEGEDGGESDGDESDGDGRCDRHGVGPHPHGARR